MRQWHNHPHHQARQVKIGISGSKWYWDTVQTCQEANVIWVVWPQPINITKISLFVMFITFFLSVSGLSFLKVSIFYFLFMKERIFNVKSISPITCHQSPTTHHPRKSPADTSMWIGLDTMHFGMKQSLLIMTLSGKHVWLKRQFTEDWMFNPNNINRDGRMENFWSMDVHDQEMQYQESHTAMDPWGNNPSKQRGSKCTNHSCWKPANHSWASCFLTWCLTSRPHCLKKTSSMQLERRDPFQVTTLWDKR